jgi:5-methylcytosine-specific restriction endonuclease McrA
MERKHHRARIARTRGAPGVFTEQDEADQLKRQHGRCFYCGSKLLNGYHADHVVPISRPDWGAHNGPENYVITCPKCNLAKGAQHPMDFAGVLF